MKLTYLFFITAAVVFVLVAFTPQSSEAGHKKRIAKFAALFMLLLKGQKKIFIPIPIPLPLPGLSLSKPSVSVHASNPWPTDPW